MRIAYFDCFAGAGGDMIVAAMLDAGLNPEFLKSQLATLGVEGLNVKIGSTRRCGIKAATFQPLVAEQKHHRNLEQITDLINNSRISDTAKLRAVEIFNKLAHAEATVHGTELKNVHFHEVGAADSIVDIVSASVGLEALDVDQVYCSTLAVGGGSITTEHGLMPAPAPATVELLKSVPIVGGPEAMELLTPTAAAILGTIVQHFAPLPSISVEAVGYGAGTINSEKFPNVVRIILGQSALATDSANADCVCLLETNSDDTTGEMIGFLIEKLLKQTTDLPFRFP